MKKYVSVFMLFTRSSLFPFLALLAVTAATELALFGIALGGGLSMEETVAQSRITWPCGLFFVLVTTVLATRTCARNAKPEYTLKRLQISSRAIFLCQAGYNSLCFLLFWLVQALVAVGLLQLYLVSMADSGLVGPQSVFLTFYQNSFLHSLLPLDDGTRYVRNLLLVLCMGLSTATVPTYQRAGMLPISTLLLAGLMIPFFPAGMANSGSDVFLPLVAIVLTGKAITQLTQRQV